MQADECRVYYREVDSNEYTEAYPAVWQEDNQQFATALVDLKEDTEYSVRAVAYQNGTAVASWEKTAKTLTSQVPVAQVINVADIYQGGRLDLSGYCGNENGFLLIQGDGATVIDAGEAYDEAVLLDNTSYVILENLVIKGGKYNGINLNGEQKNTDVHHIIIRNCDISDWGRVGTLTAVKYNTDGSVKEVQWIDDDGKYINYDAGVRLYYANDVTIEKSLIHAPKGDSIPWADTRNGITWSNSHPVGCSGIFAQGERVVIRYNDIIGNKEHMFNDAIESMSNFEKKGGLYQDCDIYGNTLAFVQDDAIELDGGQQNVRFFDNRILYCRTGISVAQNCVGPSFIYRNLLSDLRDSTGYSDLHVKAGGKKDYGTGTTHVFYNTFDTDAYQRSYGLYVLGGQFANMMSRNNIIIGGQPYRHQIYACMDESAINDFDYDLLGCRTNADGNYAGLTEVGSAETVEEHGTFGLPTFTHYRYGRYGLADSSLGYGSAVKIKGFTGSNIGALDGDESCFIKQQRPIGITVNREMLKLSPGGTLTLTLTSERDVDLGFRIIRNCEESTALSVQATEETLTAKGTVTIKVTASYQLQLADGAYYDELLVIKFDNGDAISVGVTVKNGY